MGNLWTCPFLIQSSWEPNDQRSSYEVQGEAREGCRAVCPVPFHGLFQGTIPWLPERGPAVTTCPIRPGLAFSLLRAFWLLGHTNCNLPWVLEVLQCPESPRKTQKLKLQQETCQAENSCVKLLAVMNLLVSSVYICDGSILTKSPGGPGGPAGPGKPGRPGKPCKLRED